MNIARREILRRSYSETRTRDIADKAGVSESTIIRMIGPKAQLIQASHADIWNNYLWPRIEKAVQRYPVDPSLQLVAAAEAIWSLYGDEQFRDSLMLATMHCAAGDLLISREISLTPEGNTKYIKLVDRLCRRIVSSRRAPLGLTRNALREIVLGTVDAVLIGWYSADKADEPETKISLDEALGGLRALVSARSAEEQALQTSLFL